MQRYKIMYNVTKMQLRKCNISWFLLFLLNYRLFPKAFNGSLVKACVSQQPSWSRSGELIVTPFNFPLEGVRRPRLLLPHLLSSIHKIRGIRGQKKAAQKGRLCLCGHRGRYETAMFFAVFFSSFVAFGMMTVRMPFSTLAEILSLMTSSGSV